MFYYYVITVYVTSVNQARLHVLYNCRCLELLEMNKLYISFLKVLPFGVRGIIQNIYCLYPIVYKFSGIFG